MLELNDVSLHYPGIANPVLQQLSYTINSGDFIILLGTNGSGKSSLLKLLQGEKANYSGHIHFLGRPISHYTSQELGHRITQLTQNCNDSLFPRLTIFENYLLTKHSPSLFNGKKERIFLQDYLHDFNPNLSRKINTTAQELSGGEKQALALALCLLHPPTLLLLDEHTSALDPKTSEQIMIMTQRKIREHGITCVLTTHDLDIALRYGNRILILNNGKISNTFSAEEKQDLTKEQLVKNYY